VQQKQTINRPRVPKELSQRKGINWPEAIWDRWNPLDHLFGKNDDVHKCLAVIAVQRQIEEKMRREAWATAGYPYAYQQADETAVQTQTQDAMEVDILASTAGNGCVKLKKEEEEVGVKYSPSKRAKKVEEPAYPPLVPATTFTPGGIEAQAQPAEPSSGERSQLLAVLTLIAYQGSRKCDRSFSYDEHSVMGVE